MDLAWFEPLAPISVQFEPAPSVNLSQVFLHRETMASKNDGGWQQVSKIQPNLVRAAKELRKSVAKRGNAKKMSTWQQAQNGVSTSRFVDITERVWNVQLHYCAAGIYFHWAIEWFSPDLAWGCSLSWQQLFGHPHATFDFATWFEFAQVRGTVWPGP